MNRSKRERRGIGGKASGILQIGQNGPKGGQKWGSGNFNVRETKKAESNPDLKN